MEGLSVGKSPCIAQKEAQDFGQKATQTSLTVWREWHRKAKLKAKNCLHVGETCHERYSE